ncbi:MAG: polymer-forming cytoskeletal protein [Leptospiraceae bacterium]|nr:polymer-forming cytoskeletal protein [Leptospiraceae bacterium]MDW7977064.1 polymer-forming cytoskeletal protein [Leptospiraceae bacterium]
MAKKTLLTENTNIQTIFEEGTHFSGILEFEKPLLINGYFEGEIRSKGTLIVGEKGKLKANIKAGTVIIGGEVIGNIEAFEKIEMLNTGKIIGNIRTSRLYIAEGVIFDGNCEMLTEDQINELKTSL